MRVDGVVAVQLLAQIFSEHFHMAGFVHHLRGCVIFGVYPRDGFHDFAGADERALLSVQELAEPPDYLLFVELLPLVLAPVFHRRARPSDVFSSRRQIVDRCQNLVGVDINRPVKVGLGIPLGSLGFLVEPFQFGAGALRVVPSEERVGIVDHLVDHRVQVGVGLGDLHDPINIIHPLLLRREWDLLVRASMCPVRLCAISSTVAKSSLMSLPVV